MGWRNMLVIASIPFSNVLSTADILRFSLFHFLTNSFSVPVNQPTFVRFVLAGPF